VQPGSGQAKPSGNTQAPVAAQPTASTDEQASGGSNPAGTSVQSAAVAAADDSSAASPQVKPAFGSAPAPIQTGQPATAAVAPAMGSAASLMVQIAAVSQPEDSDVLVSALRKRGYAVFARREPLDGLIHVKIGPFKSADEADKWRQKLLNDGYNAIIQQ
jgi:cell division septation protein DedD